jgi:hypothetical protein
MDQGDAQKTETKMDQGDTQKTKTKMDLDG